MSKELSCPKCEEDTECELQEFAERGSDNSEMFYVCPCGHIFDHIEDHGGGLDDY